MDERISREELRRLLVERRAQLLNDLEALQRESLGAETLESGRRAPIHLADIASDVQSQEFAADRVTLARDLLQQIDEALAKIDSDHYGLCEVCQKPISSRRLKISPWAALCVECQRQEEAAL
ncbi:MAG: TraR/DksA family transcriptional regulator [Planctomycetota bacterium]|nr:TraR/DksA family transcriptional regulator [Planctomycetota bacterium]